MPHVPDVEPTEQDISYVLLGAAIGRRMTQLLGYKPTSKKREHLIGVACVATKDVMSVLDGCDEDADAAAALVTFLGLEDAVAL